MPTRLSPAAYLPQGAYVELQQLQHLRHLARPFSAAKTLTGAQQLSGKHRSRALSRGMEFEEVRLYQHGDDIRSIDWRVTARTQVPHTKCYREEKEKPVITLVDQRRTLFFGSEHCFKSVYACHLAALINWSTLQRGDRAGGVLVGTHTIEEVRAVRTQRSLNRWLQQLTEANNALNIDKRHREPRLHDGLKQLHNSLSYGCEIAIISDFYDLDPDCERQLFQLCRHHRLTLYWLIDPLEQALPKLGKLVLSNGDESHSLNVNAALQAQHRQAYQDKRQRLKALCRRLALRLHEISTRRAPTSCFTSKPTGGHRCPGDG